MSDIVDLQLLKQKKIKKKYRCSVCVCVCVYVCVCVLVSMHLCATTFQLIEVSLFVVV